MCCVKCSAIMLSVRYFKSINKLSYKISFNIRFFANVCQTFRQKSNVDYTRSSKNSIQYQQLSSDYVEETIEFIERRFYPFENIGRCLDLKNDPAALLELRELTRAIITDGLSVIAIDEDTHQIIAAVLNKLQLKNDSVFGNAAKHWKHNRSKAYANFMQCVDNFSNLFDRFQVDCIFELMFGVSLPQYSRRGVVTDLSVMSMDIASKLSKGINVKKSIDDRELCLYPLPQSISGVYTTSIMEGIGNKIGLQVVAEKPYDEIYFPGIDFQTAIKSGTTKLKIAYKKL